MRCKRHKRMMLLKPAISHPRPAKCSYFSVSNAAAQATTDRGCKINSDCTSTREAPPVKKTMHRNTASSQNGSDEDFGSGADTGNVEILVTGWGRYALVRKVLLLIPLSDSKSLPLLSCNCDVNRCNLSCRSVVCRVFAAGDGDTLLLFNVKRKLLAVLMGY